MLPAQEASLLNEERQFLEGLEEFAVEANTLFDKAMENMPPTNPPRIKIRQPHLKIYILIRESVAIGHAVNCAAHASLQLYLDHWDDDLVAEWVQKSFRKVTCKVTDVQFEAAKKFGRYVLVTESKLPEPEVALAFLPRREWDEFFKTLSLYA